MTKRVYEQITNYRYYNNDPEWKRRKVETDYTLWQSKMNKYSKNNLYLFEYFKSKGFNFSTIWNSPNKNINNVLKDCKYYNITTNNFELKPILYILIVKLYDNTYKLKIGYTSSLDDKTKTKGLRLDRFIAHSQNFDEYYCYKIIPIEGRHIEERLHDYIKHNHPEFVVENARNNKNELVHEVYELNPKIMNICFNHIRS